MSRPKKVRGAILIGESVASTEFIDAHVFGMMNYQTLKGLFLRFLGFVEAKLGCGSHPQLIDLMRGIISKITF